MELEIQDVAQVWHRKQLEPVTGCGDRGKWIQGREGRGRGEMEVEVEVVAVVLAAKGLAAGL